jgi:hypothetical protein
MKLKGFESLSSLFVGENGNMEVNNFDMDVKNHDIKLTKNIVQFRSGIVNLPNLNFENKQLAFTVMAELMQFGYILDDSAINNLSSSSNEDIVKFHNEVIGYLKSMTGSDRNYIPFWVGFPKQVMDMEESELWLHQIAHYLSNGSYIPNDLAKERPTAFEFSEYDVISGGDEEKFLSIFTDLISINQSLTPDDVDIIKWYCRNDVKLIFPEIIPFKENLITLVAMGLDLEIKTVTDVLRVAVSLSGGDVSLPKVPSKFRKENAWSNNLVVNKEREKFKFKKFSRAERKFLLGLLEKTNCDASEAVLKLNRWLRLGEILHPGEYKNLFPNSFEMFNSIRNKKVRSWYSEVNLEFEKSFEEGLKKLSERPGEFFRRIDFLSRKNNDKLEIITNYIENISEQVSNKVLFEVYEHFEKRNITNTNRTITIKGKRSSTKLPDLEALDKNVVETIQNSVKKALYNKFSKLPKMEDTYIDEELMKIPLPKNMRSSSSSLKPIIRGSRIPIGNQNSKVIRAFVHWFDERGTQDIDLTATFIGMGKMEVIGWNGGHNSEIGTYSGDIRHRKGACAEYIDIKIDESLKEGFKYVVIDARNYNGRSFETVTDCVSGYMEREFAIEGEIFVPSTLANCLRLTNESSTTLISIIDLETREYIHLDIDQDGIPVASYNSEAILQSVKQYSEKPKFSVYHLLKMNVESRGGKIVEKDLAKNKFEFKDFSQSYVETAKFMGI